MEEIEESKAFYEVYDGAVYMFQVSVVMSKTKHSCSADWGGRWAWQHGQKLSARISTLAL